MAEGRLIGIGLYTVPEAARLTRIEGGAIFQLPINPGSRLRQLPY